MKETIRWFGRIVQFRDGKEDVNLYFPDDMSKRTLRGDTRATSFINGFSMIDGHFECTVSWTKLARRPKSKADEKAIADLAQWYGIRYGVNMEQVDEITSQDYKNATEA